MSSKLYEEFTTNGSTKLQTVAGQSYALHVAGVFNGATISLQYDVGGQTGTYTDGAFTSNGGVEFVACGEDYLTVSSAGGSTDINAQISLRSPARERR